ncbi:MAG: alcohol dehydrogenase catalytic domain-containing protein [Bacteroidota bacterium]
MKALTFQGREQIAYEDVEDPKILAPTDVIVEVSACAICGSDLHPYYEREKGLDHGCVMGHEFTGTVVEIGEDIRYMGKGSKVISAFTASCGECYYCKRGLSARCIHSQLFGWRANGQGLHGGQAQYVRVPMANHTLYRKPEGMKDELAILLGDVLSTGFFACAQGQVLPGDNVVVLGCGPVGMSAIWGAGLKLAGKIYAVDRVPARLKLAKEWGAIPINYETENVAEVIKEGTDGRGADVVIEAVGSGAATRSAFELIRPGGAISAVGVNTDTKMAFNPVEAYDKNASYHIGRCSARSFMKELLEVAMRDQDQLIQIFSHQMSLADGVEGYRIFANKLEDCTKVLLRP